jgi:hypothetical protein
MSSLNEITARARTLATSINSDANISILTDSDMGLRALLNHAVRDVYYKRAKDAKFRQEITTANVVSVTAGTGVIPATILRQYLSQADFRDAESFNLISFITYDLDFNGSNFDQLGYVRVVGDNFIYVKNGSNYTGNLTVTVPNIPDLPSDPTDDVDIKIDTLEEVIYTLALALRGEITFA